MVSETKEVAITATDDKKDSVSLVLEHLKGLSVYEALKVLYEAGETLKKKTII